jgi:hypothetical protein
MAATPPAIDAPDAADAAEMRRSYVRVMVSWLVVLAALFALQEYFS